MPRRGHNKKPGIAAGLRPRPWGLDVGSLPGSDRAGAVRFPDDRGRTKAQEAAKAVGGKAIFPIFAPGENAYPKELPPITPENYRNHLHAEKRLADAAAGKVQLSEADTAKLKESLLNDGQLAALSNMKKHTDFNDLSERSSLGKDGVERQVRSAVGKVLLDEGQRQKVQQLKQQDIEQQEQRQRRARTY